MPTRPSISVIVPSYRRPDDLRYCLDALAAQQQPPLETLVVLRAGDAASAAVANAAPAAARVRIVSVDPPGQVAALNAGRLAAAGEAIAITDDDCRPHPDWLARIADGFASDPRIGAIGGRDVLHRDGAIDDGVTRRVGRVSWYGRRVGRHHMRASRQDVHFLKGANMSYRAVALEPFDGRLRGSGAQVSNDMEASLSVARRGWRVVYDPAVRVDHHPAPRFDEDVRDGRTVAAERAEQHNELYTLLLHRPWWNRPQILAYYVLIGFRRAPGVAWATVYALRERDPRRRWRQLASFTAARRDAIGNVLRAWPPGGRSPASNASAAADAGQRVQVPSHRCNGD